MIHPGVLLTLLVQFSVLSLVAVGGASAVIPEMHRQAVEVHHWMTAQEFSELFAIAQAAPGPNVLIVTLIGWKVAGVLGALITTLAMCAPSCLLTLCVTRWWQSAAAATWRAPVQAGLAPVTVGLILATAYLLSRSADASWAALAITLASAAVVVSTKMNPLWMLAAGALLGLAGLVPG